MNTVNQPIKDTSVLYLEQSPKGGAKLRFQELGGGGTRSVWGGNTVVTYGLPNFKGGNYSGGANAPRPSP